MKVKQKQEIKRGGDENLRNLLTQRRSRDGTLFRQIY
jgi:hypothetical protein